MGYNCWLASDDVRYLATGLGFGAVAQHPLIGAAMDGYKNYTYPSGTNVIRDTKVFEHELPNWKKSDISQVLDGQIFLIGLNDYSKWAKHLYTYTWSDESTVRQRERKIMDSPTLTRSELIRWKFKCFVRSPSLIKYFDAHKGKWYERIYTFIAYDLLDYGLTYYIRRLFRKLRSKNTLN